MSKQSVTDLTASDLHGKVVLVRVDFNVPIQDGVIADDTRIKAALPTLRFLLDNGARCVLMSHLGRPKGVEDHLRLAPIAACLQALLGQAVLGLSDCIGDQVSQTITQRDDIAVFMLENVRFYQEEIDNDPNFSKQLASLADLFVQDAFGTVHRAHASTCGVADYLPAYSGLLVHDELNALDSIFKQPKRPLLAIVGGAKISTKIGVLSHLLTVVDTLIIGGAMAFTFLKAQGYGIGKSLVEEDKCDLALSLIKQANQLGKKIILPTDIVLVDQVSAESDMTIVDYSQISDHKIGVDVGPNTLAIVKSEIEQAESIIWNGPLGVFEIDSFAKGTYDVARFMADARAITIIGGGDSVAAVHNTGLADKMDHISTGGGACLAYLEGKQLPGVVCIKEKS